MGSWLCVWLGVDGWLVMCVGLMIGHVCGGVAGWLGNVKIVYMLLLS